MIGILLILFFMGGILLGMNLGWEMAHDQSPCLNLGKPEPIKEIND